MGKDKEVEAVSPNIIKGINHFVLSAQIHFTFGEEKETFEKIVDRFDTYINELRNRCLKKIAQEGGADVRFTE